jgi:uncharacterized membrane protein YfcA
LFVVGVTSAVTLAPHARAGRVRWRTGLVFGLAGMVGAYAGGRLVAFVPGGVLLTSFGVMMLVASAGMIRGRRGSGGGQEDLHLGSAIGLGVAVGAITGFVGAGGGFAIVPALVLVAGLPMPAAVGTSLLVITLQSAAGFAGHLSGTSLPWGLTLAVTATAVAGSLVGSRFTGRIPADTLRRGFGIGVLGVAGLVLAEQLPHAVLARYGPWLLTAAAVALLMTTLARTLNRQEIDMPATPVTQVRRGIEQPLGSLYSLFREVEARGMRQTSEVLALRVEQAAEAAGVLGLPPDADLFHLERLRLADDEPLAHDLVWLPVELAAPLLSADFTHAALYDELAARCSIRLTGGRERITACLPPADVRELRDCRTARRACACCAPDSSVTASSSTG